VKKEFSILDSRPPTSSENAPSRFFTIEDRRSQIENGFTLIEVMVVVVLLSLIVIALMGVFNTTQAAFRASITQTDVLEGGRAAVDLITQDLKGMSPSLGFSNGAVNFYVTNNPSYSPLLQPMTASPNNQSRTNVLENFFILSRENQTWTGTGYVVDTLSANGINPLYRFSMTTNVSALNGAVGLYDNFLFTPLTNQLFWSRLVDGVVTLRVRAYSPGGLWMSNGFVNVADYRVKNVRFLPSTVNAPTFGEVNFFMFSNTLPASVELEMATLEDRTLQRAETYPNNSIAQSNYLAQQAGKVHVFRQRVAIPNVDPAAYQ
jgi:prepilin-type N-terminal cleavage/methylation domain-containing protein